MAARLKSLPRTVAACRTSLAQHADCKHKAAKQQQALQPTFHPVLLRTTTAARGAELVAKGCTRWRPATSACLARQSPHLPAQAEARLTLNSAPTPSRPAMCATAPRKWPCAVPSAMRVRAVSMGYTATLAVTPGGGGGTARVGQGNWCGPGSTWPKPCWVRPAVCRTARWSRQADWAGRGPGQMAGLWHPPAQPAYISAPQHTKGLQRASATAEPISPTCQATRQRGHQLVRHPQLGVVPSIPPPAGAQSSLCRSFRCSQTPSTEQQHRGSLKVRCI